MSKAIERYIHGPDVGFFARDVYEAFAFADVVRAGGFLHVAGVVPLRGSLSAIQVIGEGDLRTQLAWVLEMFGTLVKRSGGRFPEDLVQIEVMTTDMNGLNTCGDVLVKAFGSHLPALTFVGVAQLFHPAQLVEVKGVAYIGDR